MQANALSKEGCHIGIKIVHVQEEPGPDLIYLCLNFLKNVPMSRVTYFTYRSLNNMWKRDYRLQTISHGLQTMSNGLLTED